MLRFVVVSLALALLAGCAAPAPPPAASDPPPSLAREEPAALLGCAVIEAIAKVPAARLAPHLPAGFEPFEDAGGGVAILGGADCAEGGRRAFLALQVEPVDEALRGDGVARYYWEPEHYAPLEEAFGAQVAALGAQLPPADVTVALTPTSASFVVGLPTGEHAATAPLGPLGPGPGFVAAGVFREYFPAAGGYAYLQGEFALPADAPFAVYPGTVATAEGTPSREVLGAEMRGPVGVAELDYEATTVGFVPYASD